MHRKSKCAIALGTGKITGAFISPWRWFLRLRVRTFQHAPNRVDAIGRDALSRNARDARLLAFLSSELRGELETHWSIFLAVQ